MTDLKLDTKSASLTPEQVRDLCFELMAMHEYGNLTFKYREEAEVLHHVIGYALAKSDEDEVIDGESTVKKIDLYQNPTP